MSGPAAYQELCRVADRNAALPRGDEDEAVEMDACGEKGEYHSMVSLVFVIEIMCVCENGHKG